MALSSKKVEILAELFKDYKFDEQFEDFIKYNDLGMPFAYGAFEGLVELTEQGKAYVEETYDLLIESLKADPNQEYDSLADLLAGIGQ